MNTKNHQWDPIFTMTYLLPMGGIGATKREIKLAHPGHACKPVEIAHS